MAITARQNRTLVAEDWRRIYQSFQNADFQSYDFETLRKGMIDYLRLYYPENFNDYIDSSEYVALVDLIAWMGQNLAFRTDLNARENFIDTAERRDSLLKLARLINYTPKRCRSAEGVLKIVGVSTTESVLDSDGVNLANLAITWNDVSNDNWADQFNAVINSALVNSQLIGRPGNTQTLAGVRTEEYSVNQPSNTLPVIPFSANVDGTAMVFEAVSATSLGRSRLYEADPRRRQVFNLLYRNDNQGNNSVNTGFFVLFKQGRLNSVDFNFEQAVPGRAVNINVNNINQDDHWLFDLAANGVEQDLWETVPAVQGVNVVYNNAVQRKIYQINSRAQDQITLVFGDGSFAQVPQGLYRFFYRVSNGLTYRISAQELQNIPISISYVSRSGRVETLTMRVSLQYTVNTASARETLDEIRSRAPQQYYTQNRMVNGEDYNIYPFTAFANIIKSKAVNRTSSGISRFLDLIDATGKYSATNVFAADGVLYTNSQSETLTFVPGVARQTQSFVESTLRPLLSGPELEHYYYANYAPTAVSNVAWWSVPAAQGSNQTTGYFYNPLVYDPNTQDRPTPLTIGPTASAPLDLFGLGALLEFQAPPDKIFNAQNLLVDRPNRALATNEKTRVYAAIKFIDAQGLGVDQGLTVSGLGAVTINEFLGSGAAVSRVIPALNNNIDGLLPGIQTRVNNLDTFGLEFDSATQQWSIQDSSPQLDAATVLVVFDNVNGVYQVRVRSLKYVFESVRETDFYFDSQTRIYDSRTGRTVSDKVTVLKTNPDPITGQSQEVDLPWFIYSPVIESDGFQNPKRVLLTFPDRDRDGVPDNPYLFDTILPVGLGAVDRLVFFQKVTGYNGVVDTVSYDRSLVVTDLPTRSAIEQSVNFYLDGQVFYATAADRFFRLLVVGNQRLVVDAPEFSSAVGRQDLQFQYQHNAPDSSRIDPSNTNIIDLFVLTRNFYNDYVLWLRDSTNIVVQPDAPTGQQLAQEFDQLNQVKSISDQLIISPAKFKPLFGNKAVPELRATFKVVKNSSVTVTDNEIKSSVIAAINQYFDVENWDFGESFYFSELSAYLHATLAPAVASVIIVPRGAGTEFGDLQQVNAMPDEIIVSAATVDNVEIVPAITAAQLGRLTSV
jgi:hypothetical protein